MFKRRSAEKAAERLFREKLYESAMEEVSQGTIRQGLWGQALAESEGDEEQARAKYLVVRVQSMIDEAKVRQFSEDERLKNLGEQERKDAANELIKKRHSVKLSNAKTVKSKRKSLLPFDFYLLAIVAFFAILFLATYLS